MFSTVIFDMDGVLIDTERICAQAWQESGRLNQVADIQVTIRECIGLNEGDTRAYFMKKYGMDFPYEAFRCDSSRIFWEIADRDRIPVKPGVYELMDFLRETGFQVGLASSTRESSVRAHMERTGLIGYFQKIVTGDMVKHSKPHPEIYQLACSQMGTLPEKTIAIEDSPNGIRSAWEAGLKTIMVPDMIQPDSAVKAMLYGCYPSLLEVKEFLEKRRKSDESK